MNLIHGLRLVIIIIIKKGIRLTDAKLPIKMRDIFSRDLR